ncbi:MAG: discoidin domain-containing protein [Verrucomicrobiota bacterium]
MTTSHTTPRVCSLLGTIATVFWLATPVIFAKDYYVSQSCGDDAATGLTKVPGKGAGPWKTLSKASSKYAAGDHILLQCGDTWNEEFAPKGEGSPQNPIVIASYGQGAKPIIDRQDDKQDRVGIRLADQGGFKIVGIEFSHCMTGIYAEYSKGCPTKTYISIENCYFHDSLMYRHYEDYPKTKIGLGICFFTFELENHKVLTDVTIKDCVFRRLASGVWTNSPDNFNKNASFIYPFGNMTFDNCLFEEGYQWPQGLRGVERGAMRNCVTHDVGRGFKSFNGVAGSMFFRCKDWVFDNCEWGFIDIGTGSGDGEAFDFEGNCDNMLMRDCLFHDTDGPGFLLCCYASDGNPNKAIKMENCVLNGKAKRPPRGTGKVAILNTTDHTEATWSKCRFYLSPSEGLMRVADPEKDKHSKFENCYIKSLTKACASPNLAAKAQATASTARVGNEAAKAIDGNEGTAWKAGGSKDQWLELTFAAPVTINEIKLKEDSSSSIIRYVIEYWDAKVQKWTGCFNGRGMGQDFVAPIVSRSTRKIRLRVLETTDGNPCISEFGVYNDTPGDLFNDPTGAKAIGVINK